MICRRPLKKKLEKLIKINGFCGTSIKQTGTPIKNNGFCRTRPASPTPAQDHRKLCFYSFCFCFFYVPLGFSIVLAETICFTKENQDFSGQPAPVQDSAAAQPQPKTSGDYGFIVLLLFVLFPSVFRPFWWTILVLLSKSHNSRHGPMD